MPTFCLMWQTVGVAMGKVVLFPGDVAWFSAADWRKDSYVVLNEEGEVWLSFLVARRPGTGALTRLLGEIDRLEKEPVIVCPLGAMQSIIRRKGFRPHHGGLLWLRDNRMEHSDVGA